MTSLIDEAIQIAQEHDLKIIACGSDKAPIHKGWRERATSDPDEIRELFSHPDAALVGVPMGTANDLIAFDIDYREGNTTERNEKLVTVAHALETYHPGQIRMHGTRNGGVHYIMLNPEGVKKIPRNLMPKLEICGEGFQIIWPTRGSGYKVLDPVPLDDLAEPDPQFLKVREKMPGISHDGGLMSAEMAKQVMVSDGEVGTRHDALLRMTYDFVADAPSDLSGAELCQRFENQFRSVYGEFIEQTRLDELMNWHDNDGELGGSDLGNAMKGALERHPERRLDRLAGLKPPELDIFDRKIAPQEWELTPADDVALLQQQQAEAKALGEQVKKEGEEVRKQMAADFPNGEIDWAAEIEPRQWLLSHRIERGEVSALQGPPGGGKTATLIGWIGVLASGVSFLHEKAWGGPKNVVYLNGDDSQVEILRRLRAFRLHHKNAGSLMGDHIRYLHQPMPLVVEDPAARRRTVREDELAVELLTTKLAEWDTDVLVIDPLPSIHQINESEASEMKLLLSVLRRIARTLNIAVVVAQHWKPAAEGDSALPNPFNGMVRHVTQLRAMKKNEAEAYAQPADQRHRFLMLWDAKVNNEAQKVHQWLRLDPVDLDNGTDVYGQDRVAVVTRWEPGGDPQLAVKIERAVELLRDEWARICDDSERVVLAWANSPRWFGQRIVKALMEDQVLQDGVAKDKVGEAEQRARTEAQGIINALSELKLIIKRQDVPGSNRAMTWGYHVNDHKFDAGHWKKDIK